MAQKPKTAPRTKPSELPLFPERGTPTWEVAYLFPAQGGWTEHEYFNLDQFCDGIPRIELSNGRLEVLPMPTELHQMIIRILFRLLDSFTASHAPGLVLPPGMRIKL